MRQHLWRRLKQVALTDVSVLVRGLPHDAMEAFEQTLIEADFGPTAFDLVEALEDAVRRGQLKSEGALRGWLVDRVAEAAGNGGPRGEGLGLDLPADGGPGVVLLLGVNGVGKTTLAAKLARRIQGSGRTVLLAAADTFRAGAGEQLNVWAERLGVPCVTGARGGDPAAVAFDAIDAAEARGVDVVVVDTAGRLHTETDLVAELAKIARVVSRRRAGAPHESLLVLDGTVGQNALHQGRVFAGAVPVTGLVVTKLDGTAKGGAVLVLRRELGVPVRFVGVGEGMDDLEPFDPRAFAERLIGN